MEYCQIRQFSKYNWTYVNIILSNSIITKCNYTDPLGIKLYTDGDATVIGGTWGFPALLEVFQNNLLQDLNAFKSLKAGGAGNSLSLKKLNEHYAYKLEKVLSDGTTAVTKKKKGLTTRAQMSTHVNARYLDLFAMDKAAKKWSRGSAVLTHMYYNLGGTFRDDGRQFAYCTTLLEIFACFLKLVGIPKEMDSDACEHCTCWKWDVSAADRYGDDDVRIYQRKEASVNEHGDTPVHQSEDVAEQYDASYKESESLKAVNTLLMEKIDLHLPPAVPEVWRQALKKALACEGMRDMGDPTFEELFEQNKRFFTIAQQGPKGDYQEDLVSIGLALENIKITRKENMAKKKKLEKVLFQPFAKYLLDVRGVDLDDPNSGFRVSAMI
ncbi:hypothetical protein GIB67_035004 [Kingdonia uniflora]|uniref:Uncharacterized protein n=1 Tax=Kingdonia uniflora TaxID=39325 RepID=A0A7J7M3K9_9MAGN|nr:hypothetical protein GIB67_035004 [Kingdonia uniflora]